ncbi:glycerate kinase [Bordetella pseudohinzii]|uniref:Glycerate kinase n=1 Tax=Bordetella pseudohinzii TaxID=1331258 RepID=A0A0J6C4V6_9BORD|nr:glycerate kinase [Bordetella pseudohinzii]ANY15101.1 glycerate kinase [Bordetella pseudohinzii]KMM26143.1 glycerate kinase [Bordetella pseudohinzii]KXA80009.1 glycerate kinase [Bordetella pseudohinzii]KXA82871.1 glycerate kinase [Bordetella pseudohinzii]CUI52520.1 Glycerate kinase [Bordetella pseudohinzii]
MKIVIAPDSFKESLDAAAAARAIERGVKLACPGAHTVRVPMADGGEGTVDAVLAATGGQARLARVRDALGRPVQARWGWLDHATAVIEMASAAGLEGIAPAERDALAADTHGVGELILAALDSGARKLILGLGGSATTDGGSGMLRALGARFLDAADQPLAPGGGALRALARIDLDGLDPRLAGLEVEVACDVDNPLCGPQGAAHVFGPQKGANPAQVEQLDAALSRLADVAHRVLGQDHRNAAGAGAAGGLGFAAHAFLRGRFRPGVALVAELGGLAQALQGATLVFTGEGRMDAQTLRGKTPAGVARLAREAGVPVVALAGSLGEGYEALHAAGITAAFSLVPGPHSLDQALAHADDYLAARARDIMQLWMAAARRRL